MQQCVSQTMVMNIQALSYPHTCEYVFFQLLLVEVKVLYSISTLVGVNLTRYIGWDGNFIILIISNHYTNMLLLVRVKVNNVINIIDEVYLANIIGEVDRWISF